MDDDITPMPRHMDSGWLLQDGSYILLPDQDEYSFTHHDYVKKCGERGSDCGYWEFMKECGAIRIRGDYEYIYITARKKPTKEQLEAIREIFRWTHTDDMQGQLDGGEDGTCIIELDNPRPMDVQKFNRCWE